LRKSIVVKSEDRRKMAVKVALIGNMNNTYFSVVRYLRDRGIDAHLFLLNNEHPQFHPSNDTFDLSYQNYTIQLGWGDCQSFYKMTGEKIDRDLRGYDFIIGCNAVPAFLHKIDRRIDIFATYGSDFYALPFIPPIPNPLRKLKYYFQYHTFHEAQRKGVRDACVINKEDVLPFSRKIVKKLGVSSKMYYFSQPAVYNKIFSSDTIKSYYNRSAWYHEFKRIRDNFDPVIFHHSRHIWKTYVDEHSNKGNDILIRGVGEYIKKNPGVNGCLVLFEYGPDVDASKELVEKMGIKKNVQWFPMMPRKEILIGLSLADLVTGQFSIGAVSCGTILEGLALGKPILHYKDETQPDLEGISDYPYIQVRTESDICDVLNDYCRNPAAYLEIGKEAAEWYDTNYAKRCMDKYVQLIEAKAGGNFPQIIEQWKSEIKA